MACHEVLGMFDEVAEAERALEMSEFSIRRMLREVVDSLSGEIEQKEQKLEINMSIMHEFVFGESICVR